MPRPDMAPGFYACWVSLLKPVETRAHLIAGEIGLTGFISYHGAQYNHREIQRAGNINLNGKTTKAHYPL